MKFNRWVVAAAIINSQTAGVLLADDNADTIQQLKQQIEALDQKVKILERHRELDQDSAGEIAKTTPRLSAGAGGFAFISADTNFVLKVRGYVQADGCFYADNKIQGNSTFLLRRVRPIFEGTVFKDYDFRVMLDLGANTSGTSANTGNNGLLQDAYVNIHYWPEAQLQIGKFKEPVGLERLQSGANLLFVERGFPTQLVPNRDVGIQLHGQLWKGALNYAVGVFNGTADGGSGDIETADNDKDVAARLFAHPFKNTSIESLRGLGLGLSGTIGNQLGALRGFTTPGQQRFFAYRTGTGTSAATANITAGGEHTRIAPQAYYYWGPFGVFGEYVISSQNVTRTAGGAPLKQKVENRAWQIAGSYILTGEDNSFGALVPRHPFTIGGDGWGAWEIAARAGGLSVDRSAFPLFATASSASDAFSWGVGLNWYLNKNVKFNFDYEQTSFTGGSKATGQVTAQDERVFLVRAQFAF